MENYYGAYVHNLCPKSSCEGDVVEVDELIILPIKLLNEKGYFTEFCCSGHYFKAIPNTYIKFQENYRFKTLPKNFVQDGEYTIRRNYERDLGDSDLHNQRIDSIHNLLDWAESLDDCVEELLPIKGEQYHYTYDGEFLDFNNSRISSFSIDNLDDKHLNFYYDIKNNQIL